jgi:hypothetical protein
MTLDDIYTEWDKDSKIDQTELAKEALKIPQLHNKYYKFYNKERLALRKLEHDFKSLKHDKYEFYTMGPNEDTPSDWELPPRGNILKSEVNQYLDADKDLINISLKIGYAQEKVELIESIIKSLVNRGFQIKSAIDWVKFQNGL